MAFTIPTIDIAGLTSADISDRRATAAAIRGACRSTGFFYVTNHGIPDKLVHDTLA